MIAPTGRSLLAEVRNSIANAIVAMLATRPPDHRERNRDKDRQADDDRDQRQEDDIEHYAGGAVRLVQEEHNMTVNAGSGV